MHVVTKISKSTIKLILKIIYKISKYYCMWYQDNFAYEEIDLDHLLDEWNDMVVASKDYGLNSNINSPEDYKDELL